MIIVTVPLVMAMIVTSMIVTSMIVTGMIATAMGMRLRICELSLPAGGAPFRSRSCGS
jgi:hypothetical protein